MVNKENFPDDESLSKPSVEVSSRLETKLLTSTTLDSPPSCLEFVPSDPDYFIVGTYVLEAGDSVSLGPETRRSGRLHVFKYTELQL